MWRPEFLVVSGTPASTCAGFGQESCTDQNGNYTTITSTTTPLTIGETYWIVVSSNGNSSGGTISVCVTNAPPGPCQHNQDCSAPLTVALNAPGAGAACVTDCNTGASAGPDFAGANCFDLPNETVWYSITTGATTTSLDIDLTSTDLSDPEFTLFTTDCSLFTVIDCNEGTGGTANSAGVAVLPNTTYIIAVSDNTGDEGDFDLCITQNEPGACNANEECATAIAIPLNGAGNAQACQAGCNTGATPGIDFTGPAICAEMLNATVWYTITTGATTATIDVDLTSADLSDPEFAIFTDNGCGTLWTTVFCLEGTGGAASSLGIPVTPNTTYIIAISDDSGDEGNFNFCVTENADNSACNTNNALTVSATSMGSPLTGPFLPGEIVSFCYTITDFTQFNCNYLGAIIPEFGDCWDPISFNGNGEPVNVTTPLVPAGVFDFGPPAPFCEGNATGAWGWEATGGVTYNNIAGGYYPANSILPAGWFFLTSYDSQQAFAGCGGPAETDPDNSFGDSDYPTCANNTLDWQVCFDLQAKAVIACTNGETDCVVSIKTLADGEFGAWDNLGCTIDGLTSMPGSINCALPVELAEFTAVYDKPSVLIDWKTITESGTSHFVVSHVDAKGELYEIGTVEAVGNSQNEVNYRFVHETPIPGINYYNLKAVDFDGTIEDHGSVSIKANFGYAFFDSKAKQIVLTYSSNVEIYAMDGSLIKTSNGTTRIDFEKTGVYLIRDLTTGVMQRIVATW
jgi:hypothetical protein